MQFYVGWVRTRSVLNKPCKKYRKPSICSANYKTKVCTNQDDVADSMKTTLCLALRNHGTQGAILFETYAQVRWKKANHRLREAYESSGHLSILRTCCIYMVYGSSLGFVSVTQSFRRCDILFRLDRPSYYDAMSLRKPRMVLVKAVYIVACFFYDSIYVGARDICSFPSWVRCDICISGF